MNAWGEKKVSNGYESMGQLGNCYMTSYNALDDGVVLTEYWKLVHGICVLTGGPNEGLQFGHAWLELDGCVYNVETDQIIPKGVFYKVGSVSYTAVYTMTEAREMALEHENFGPWDEKILEVL